LQTRSTTPAILSKIGGMVRPLHPTQIRLLELLKSNSVEPLTVRELQGLLGISSPSVVQHHIRQLEKNGYLLRDKFNPREYHVLADEPEKKITYLNLYGLASCGPGSSLLDGNPIDRIPISTQLLGFPSSEAFLVKAKGDSMAPTIKEKDLVIARKSQLAETGSIVVCVNDGSALIKKIMKLKDHFVLRSINPAYEPFEASEDFRIEGVVKSVISYFP
jgi:repressor LexA